MTPMVALEALQSGRPRLSAVLSQVVTRHSGPPSDDATLIIVVVSILGGVAIVCALVGGAIALTRMAMRHRERMARIGMGLDPDGPDPLSGLPTERSSTPNASSGAWDRFAASRSEGPPKG
jgi:hypothetical protein